MDLCPGAAFDGAPGDLARNRCGLGIEKSGILNRVWSEMRNFHFVFGVGDFLDLSGDAA
jgi:hypothetical protein